MRPSVQAVFRRPFTARFEGDALPYPYTDSLGLLTTGSGNLIEGGVGLALPWTIDGRPASQPEIASQLATVKESWPDVQSVNSQSLSTIRLSDDALASLFSEAVERAESEIRAHYPRYDDWPADGQLAILSMSWAMGGGFQFPELEKALNAPSPQFADAAPPKSLGHFRGSGISERVEANDVCWRNAAIVAVWRLDYDSLHWPKEIDNVAIALDWAKRAAIVGVPLAMLAASSTGAGRALLRRAWEGALASW